VTTQILGLLFVFSTALAASASVSDAERTEVSIANAFGFVMGEKLGVGVPAVQDSISKLFAISLDAGRFPPFDAITVNALVWPNCLFRDRFVPQQ
jgi:hypothetical protein